jgi:hypothetical protein
MHCPMWLLGLASVAAALLAFGGLTFGVWLLLRRRESQP